MRLASDNSWTRRRLKHLSWRSWWIILCTLDRIMTVSCEISRADRCLFGLSSLLSTRSPLLRAERDLPLPGSQTVCTRLADSLQQTVDTSKFPTLVGQFTQQSSCTILLWQIIIIIIISGLGIYGAAVVPDSGVGNTSHSFSMNSCLTGWHHPGCI